MERRRLLPHLVTLSTLAAVVALILLVLLSDRCSGETGGVPVTPPAPITVVPPAAEVEPGRVRLEAQPSQDAPSVEVDDAEATDAEYLPGNEGTVPDEVKGSGDATLWLRLVDGETLRPVLTVAVDLWRIGVSAHDGWSAGDHIQWSGHVPTDGKVLAGLPPGTYRARCDFQRHTSEDPPSFTISSGENEVALRVAMPRTLPVRALVFTASGERIFRVTSGVGRNNHSSSRIPTAPDWASVRRHDRLQWNLRFGGRRGGSSGRRVRDIEDDGSGFDLGTILEATRIGVASRRVNLVPEGGTTVRCAVSGRRVREGSVYVGLSVPVADLLSDVVTSDGEPFDVQAAHVEAVSEARVMGEDEADEAWRHLVIEVSLAALGHQPLQFTWRVGDPWPAHRMTPVK